MYQREGWNSYFFPILKGKNSQETSSRAERWKVNCRFPYHWILFYFRKNAEVYWYLLYKLVILGFPLFISFFIASLSSKCVSHALAVPPLYPWTFQKTFAHARVNLKKYFGTLDFKLVSERKNNIDMGSSRSPKKPNCTQIRKLIILLFRHSMRDTTLFCC